jgi:hypothetical protein
MKHDAYMSRRQQLILTFEQETSKKFDDINGLCCRSYTEWLENRLSTSHNSEKYDKKEL